MQPLYSTTAAAPSEGSMVAGLLLPIEQQRGAILPTLVPLGLNESGGGLDLSGSDPLRIAGLGSGQPSNGSGSLSSSSSSSTVAMGVDDQGAPTMRRPELVDNGLIESILLKMNVMAIDERSLVCLLIAYSLLIMTGALGNGLVCVAVARKPAMRTARNVYIINLAISDLILCLFTMPFTLVEIVLRFWPLGTLTCKLAAGLEATSIFVSTISITAIAIDRYKVIVYPSREMFRPKVAFLTILAIWGFALLLAAPLFVYRTVFQNKIPVETRDLLRRHGFETGMTSLDYCVENWPHEQGRFYYSAFTIVFQYMLPIIIVSLAYASICRKLRCRMVGTGSKLEEKLMRERRRAQLLISITLVFILSWLPLNILNTYVDYFNPALLTRDPATFKILFACCHMWGMSSACSNPFLYGWLNDNFRKEFKEILGTCLGKHIKLHTPVRASTLEESQAPPAKKDSSSPPGGAASDVRPAHQEDTAVLRDREKVSTTLLQDAEDARPRVAMLPKVQPTGSLV